MDQDQAQDQDQDQDQDRIALQIERCRRLASQTSDDELRHSLEKLAEQYQAQLPKRPDSFMLGSKERR